MTRRATATLQTVGLSVLMVALTMLAAWSLLGVWSIALAAVLAVMAYRAFDRSSLPVRLANARPLGAYEAPWLHQVVARLAWRAGLPATPRIYLSGSAVPNAAAMGSREDAAIFVTPSLVRGLSERELAGVLAHEVSHIRNNDLGLYRFTELVRFFATVTSRMGWLLLVISLPLLMSGVTRVPALSILLLVASPLAAQLLQLAIMRSREHAADLGAAELTGDPEGLAGALERIEHHNRWILRALLPFGAPEENGLLRSHPTTVDRVRRLRELAWATA